MRSGEISQRGYDSLCLPWCIFWLRADWTFGRKEQDVLRAGLEAHCGTEFKNEVIGDISARSYPEARTFLPSRPFSLRDLTLMNASYQTTN